jgi:hypothetical protein
MILYNLTIKIDHSIQEDWLEWMETEFIPLVQSSTPFSESKLCKLLDLDEADGITFALQLFCQNKNQLEAFRSEKERTLQLKLLQQFPNKLVFFSTAMEIL